MAKVVARVVAKAVVSVVDVLTRGVERIGQGLFEAKASSGFQRVKVSDRSSRWMRWMMKRWASLVVLGWCCAFGFAITALAHPGGHGPTAGTTPLAWRAWTVDGKPAAVR